jgi:hypothetical protein
MLQAEVNHLRQENIKLRTAVATALTRKHVPCEAGEPWWWPLEDALGIPRSPKGRPSATSLAPLKPASDTRAT